MPGGTRGHDSECPIAFTLDVLGDRWTLLVVRDLLFARKRRFSEFLESPEGIATNVLADRLHRLEETGLIESATDPADRRRVLYDLTDKGLDLLPALLELVRWGARYGGETRAPAGLVRRIERDRDGLIAEIRARRRARDLP